jgi:hypothetical protein
METNLPGKYFLLAAEKLVFDILTQNPQGLTNAQVAQKTGLFVQIKNQKGYITWSILMSLVESGEVIKDEKIFRII